MDDKWYREYISGVPTGNGFASNDFIVSMRFIQTLERLGVMKVRPMFLGRSHDHVLLSVDEVVYDEPTAFWKLRFRGGGGR